MHNNELNIRQTYAREASRLAQKIGRYAHALKKLSPRVGRIMRELQRQLSKLEGLPLIEAKRLLEQAWQLRLQAQDSNTKNKL